MSKIQGFFPLFLATVFGVANGVWVFGPAFKEQRENEASLKTQLAASPEIEKRRVEELRIIEAAINNASTTQAAVKATEKSNSWWTSVSGWGRASGNSNTEAEGAKTRGPKSMSEDTDNLAQKSPTMMENISVPVATDNRESVVGKLAEQVAKDPSLKILLDAVASGKATKDQLGTFQTHINELKRR